MNSIFIPFNVPSLKNSKIKTSRGIFPSRTVKKYLQNLGILKYSSSKKKVDEYKTRENVFKDKAYEIKQQLKHMEPPYKIGFHFVRDSKRKFDFHNAIQIVADLLVAHDALEDDNMDYFIPFPSKRKGRFYSYDKENPGVYIKVFK